MDKIIASPQYGRIFKPALKIALIIGMCSGIILVLYAISMCILFAINVFEYTKGIYPALIVFVFFGILLFIWDLRLLIREAELKRNLIKWQNDFIKIYANVEIVTQGDKLLKDYIVAAKFHYNETFCEKTNRAGNYLVGYDRILKSCTGNSVPILYSPTYNEYVFIKENS